MKVGPGQLYLILTGHTYEEDWSKHRHTQYHTTDMLTATIITLVCQVSTVNC